MKPDPCPLRSEGAPYTPDRVALAGNPNCGKTTIFNALAGARQHVGNYPGVTVEKKEGFCSFGGRLFSLIDLPGTYSLSAHSQDEEVTRKYLMESRPDIVINVIDASNLSRNLYLTIQLLELRLPVVVCLNMKDVAEKKGIFIDEKALSAKLHCPVVSTVGRKNQGVEGLLEVISGYYQYPRPVFNMRYHDEIEAELAKLTAIAVKDPDMPIRVSARYLSLKLLEGQKLVEKRIKGSVVEAELLEQRRQSWQKLRSSLKDSVAGSMADNRYVYIEELLKGVVEQGRALKEDFSDKIDEVLTNKLLAIPIFAVVMWLVFTLTFTLAEIPMGWIESLFGLLGDSVSAILPPGLLSSLLIDGVIGGVGGVLVFVPNIALLFLAIAFLEDSGYMARAAFIMDQTMHRFGMHGQSFIPMLIGFGCTVPAYMASRSLGNRRDRLITMHINTFMSCGARLPVYVLFCGAFWPAHLAGHIMFGLYLLGILAAITAAKLLAAFRFKESATPFIMELPPYHAPTAKGLLIHTWERAWMYIKKAGTFILAASIIMWALMTFPKLDTYTRDYQAEITSIERSAYAADVKREKVLELEGQMAFEKISHSTAGRLGRFIEPVLKPLGFDWRLGVGLISGLAAKEVVVSTLGTLMSAGEVDEQSESLRHRLQADTAYSPLVAMGFMVFVLLYAPCLSAMAVFHREAGSWRETVFQFTYTTALAYGAAFVIYQGGRLLGVG